jgi:hypothetical protein
VPLVLQVRHGLPEVQLGRDVAEAPVVSLKLYTAKENPNAG